MKPRTAVDIKCPLVNLPVHWYKNGMRITTGSYYYVDEENGTLTINKAGIWSFKKILAGSSHCRPILHFILCIVIIVRTMMDY